MPKIITNDTIKFFSQTAISIWQFQTTTVSECCFTKLLPYSSFENIYSYFSVGNGQPREPALCQLYRHMHFRSPFSVQPQVCSVKFSSRLVNIWQTCRQKYIQRATFHAPPCIHCMVSTYSTIIATFAGGGCLFLREYSCEHARPTNNTVRHSENISERPT